MKKVLAIVLLIILGTEVTMATLKNAGAGRAKDDVATPSRSTQVFQQQPRPQQGGGGSGNGNGGGTPTYNPSVGNQSQIKLPAWLENLFNRDTPAYGGSYNPSTGNQSQINLTRPAAYGGTYNPTAPVPTIPSWIQNQYSRPAAYGGEGYNPTTSNVPAWLQGQVSRPAAYTGTPTPINLTRPAAYGGTYNPSNIQAQGRPVNPNDGNIYNNNAPGTTQFGTPNMGVNTFIGGGGEAVRSPQARGRTMFGAGVGPGTLDPSLWNLSAQGNGGGGGSGGFGSRYGGNWGGGGGGGGWDYGGGGSNDYPAWVKTLMGLNSWNIK